MAKYLLLVILLLSPIRSSHAQTSNYCYCTNNYTYNTAYGGYTCLANTTCWACQPGAYNNSWQQAFCPNYQATQVTCTTTFAEKTESCPVHYSGIKKYKQETKTCTDGTVTQGSWQLYSNTCTQDPPTCQVSSQQQTLSCPTGYTGSITQTRSSTCPDPYGNQVWQPWVTTTDSCVKSITNPTNVTSPVSPISPVNPTSVTAVAPTTQTQTTTTSSTSVQTTQSSPVTAEVQPTAQNSETTPTTSTATSSAPTAASSATQTPAPADAKGTASGTTSTTQATPTPAPKGKIPSAVGLVLSLEVITKPALTQPNVFTEPQIVQGLPNDILFSNQLFLDVYGGTLSDQSDKFKQMAADTVEIEQ